MSYSNLFPISDSFPQDSNVTFHDAWSLTWELKFQFNARSGYCENNRYEKHLRKTIGPLKLTEITPLLLEGLKAKIYKSGLSSQTIKHVFNIIKRVFNCVIKYDLYNGDNPMSKISIQCEDRNRHRFLTKDEAHMLLSALKLKSEQLWQISLLSLSTGMRASEIFHLRGEHVNLDSRTIRILDPKNGKNRSVYLPDSAYQMLRDCHLKYGQLVFPNRVGKPYQAAQRAFYRIVNKLGFNDGLDDPSTQSMLNIRMQ